MRQYLLSSPYTEAQLVPADAITTLAPGTLLLVRPTHDTAVESIIAGVRERQRQLPHATICLWLDLVQKNTVPNVVARAADLAIRGCITRAIPDAVQLRGQITDVSHLGRDLALRFKVLGFATDAAVGEFLVLAAEHARDWRNVQELSSACGINYRSLNGSLVRASLGTPATLYHIIRLIRVAVELQRDTRRAIHYVATEFGFWDESHLRNRIRTVFGVGPAQVREWIGWERLLYWSLRRAGLRGPA